MNQVLRSGEVAAQANVNIETLRYYERRGLLDEPPRLSSGQRRYSADTVRRVRAIKQAQSLGFTLDEIESLLALRGRQLDHDAGGAVVAAAKEKLRQVEEKEAALNDIKSRLQEVVAKGCDSLVDCACGDCPLDGSHTSGRSGGSSSEGSDGDKEAVAAGSGGPSVARSVAQVIPAGALAVVACAVCLLPALVAGVGVGALGAPLERLEVGPLALPVIVAMTAMLALARFPRRATACSCHGK